jgi:hypothetical protein
VVDKVKNKDIATYALYLRELLNENKDTKWTHLLKNF